MEKCAEQVTNPSWADWAEGEHCPTTAGSQADMMQGRHPTCQNREEIRGILTGEEYSVDPFATLRPNVSGILYREMPGLNSSRNESRSPHLSRKRGFFSRICLGVSFSNSQIIWGGQCIHRAGLLLSLKGKWRWLLTVLLHFHIAPISPETGCSVSQKQSF